MAKQIIARRYLDAVYLTLVKVQGRREIKNSLGQTETRATHLELLLLTGIKSSLHIIHCLFMNINFMHSVT